MHPHQPHSAGRRRARSPSVVGAAGYRSEPAAKRLRLVSQEPPAAVLGTPLCRRTVSPSLSLTSIVPLTGSPNRVFGAYDRFDELGWLRGLLGRLRPGDGAPSSSSSSSSTSPAGGSPFHRTLPTAEGLTTPKSLATPGSLVWTANSSPPDVQPDDGGLDEQDPPLLGSDHLLHDTVRGSLTTGSQGSAPATPRERTQQATQGAYPPSPPARPSSGRQSTPTHTSPSADGSVAEQSLALLQDLFAVPQEHLPGLGSASEAMCTPRRQDVAVQVATVPTEIAYPSKAPPASPIRHEAMVQVSTAQEHVPDHGPSRPMEEQDRHMMMAAEHEACAPAVNEAEVRRQVAVLNDGLVTAEHQAGDAQVATEAERGADAERAHQEEAQLAEDQRLAQAELAARCAEESCLAEKASPAEANRLAEQAWKAEQVELQVDEARKAQEARQAQEAHAAVDARLARLAEEERLAVAACLAAARSKAVKRSLLKDKDLPEDHAVRMEPHSSGGKQEDLCLEPSSTVTTTDTGRTDTGRGLQVANRLAERLQIVGQLRLAVEQRLAAEKERERSTREDGLDESRRSIEQERRCELQHQAQARVEPEREIQDEQTHMAQQDCFVLGEQERLVEQIRVVKLVRLAERKRLAEKERWAQQERAAEQARRAEQSRLVAARRLAEKVLRVEEAREADAARLAEEERLAEEVRLTDELCLAQEVGLLQDAPNVCESYGSEEAQSVVPESACAQNRSNFATEQQRLDQVNVWAEDVPLGDDARLKEVLLAGEQQPTAEVQLATAGHPDNDSGKTEGVPDGCGAYEVPCPDDEAISAAKSCGAEPSLHQARQDQTTSQSRQEDRESPMGQGDVSHQTCLPDSGSVLFSWDDLFIQPPLEDEPKDAHSAVLTAEDSDEDNHHQAEDVGQMKQLVRGLHSNTHSEPVTSGDHEPTTNAISSSSYAPAQAEAPVRKPIRKHTNVHHGGHRPVTRSQCPYHVVQLPRGHRPGTFLLPKCTLDASTLEDEDAQDCGPASADQRARQIDLATIQLPTLTQQVLSRVVNDPTIVHELFVLPQYDGFGQSDVAEHEADAEDEPTELDLGPNLSPGVFFHPGRDTFLGNHILQTPQADSSLRLSVGSPTSPALVSSAGSPSGPRSIASTTRATKGAGRRSQRSRKRRETPQTHDVLLTQGGPGWTTTSFITPYPRRRARLTDAEMLATRTPTKKGKDPEHS